MLLNKEYNGKLLLNPEVDESRTSHPANGKRDKTFSYNSTHVAITFGTFTLNKNDVIDIQTKTTTGYIKDAKPKGRYKAIKLAQ